jgi:hypothetical protein
MTTLARIDAELCDIREGDYIQTFTGRKFWPLDPRPEEIDIQDIAHALSMTCRFNGHTSRFYSVAEHCVHVSLLVPPADALWGLLHDAAEAYISDLSRPIKKNSRLGDEYALIEKRLMLNVEVAFDLGDEPASIKEADNRMLAVEAGKLMNHDPELWSGQLVPLTGNEPGIQCWTPFRARTIFRWRFNQLMAERLLVEKESA